MIFLLAIPVVVIGFLFSALCFRVVVSTNDMHIVQRAKTTTSYGKDQSGGNVYYKWPSWIPFFGVRTSILPVSVFAQNLNDYAGYDKGRVPFVIDIIAFFRISESNIAAQRVASLQALNVQLEFILKGVIRTILASSDIEEILEGRSKFGEMFTKEVDEQLKQWGVQTVKCIELMDIRDAANSKVIANIMEKKKSLIEMQSRVAVAENIQTAEVAEVNARQTVEIRKREAEQLVGIRAAERDQAVGIANQKSNQAVKEEEKATAVKTMAIAEVNQVRQSEIDRASQLVVADRVRQVMVIEADAKQQQVVIEATGRKQQLTLVAEGDLESAKRNAEAIRVEGVARGDAEKAVLMAPVTAQITLAKEIGENEPYQTYLLSIRRIEADQVVGVEQAKALASADVKVIANTGSVIEGTNDVMQLLTPKGGTQLGGMLTALANTEAGAALVNRFASK